LDLIIYLDRDSNVVFTKAYDTEDGISIHDISNLTESIVPGLEPLGVTMAGGGRSGFVQTSSGIMMFSVWPVQDSDELLEPNGALLMARFVSDAVFQKILLPVHTQARLSSIYSTGEMQELADTMAAQNLSKLFSVADGDTLMAYTVVKDFKGEPLLVLSIAMERALYQQVLVTIRYFQVFLLTVMVAIGSLTLLILELLMLRKLSALSSGVNSIGLDRNHSSRLNIRGSDEISKLALNINTMLDLRGKAESTQAELNSRLSGKVEELERYKRLTAHRELRMEELKRELQSLKEGNLNAD